MQTPPKEAILELLEMNSAIIRMQTRGISQEQSLIQPPYGGNCLNWVIGHILTSRQTIFNFLKIEPILSPEELAIYDRGSEVLIDPAQAADLSKLLKNVKVSEDLIRKGLDSLPKGALDEVTPFGRSSGPLGGHILFLIWHETYHVGQLELLRQLAGKREKLI